MTELPLQADRPMQQPEAGRMHVVILLAVLELLIGVQLAIALGVKR